MDEVLKLKELLNVYDNAYYNEDDSIVTDSEYDALKKRYVELAGEYSYVPGVASSGLTKHKHTFPIKSLGKLDGKADVREELRKELLRLCPGVIQPKLDGLTLVDYGNDLKVTRGDGETGENVSHTASKIKMPVIKFARNPIRGEALMLISVFNDLNAKRNAEGLKPFKNPRNTAAGMLRNKNADKVEGLSFFAYSIVGAKEKETDQLNLLQAMGFTTVDCMEFTEDTIEETIEWILNFDRSDLDYEIDGLVIKSNKPDSFNLFGETSHHPKNAVAYKFPNQGVWTRILDIEWKTGRTGKVAPRAILQPAELMGATVQHATLHNIAYIDAIKLSAGCDVFLVKAKDVIPAITESRNFKPNLAFNAPTDCPECGSLLALENDQLYCENTLCKSRLVANIAHMASRDALNIEGLSESTAQKIVDMYYGSSVNNHWDIFDLTFEQVKVLEGFADKSAKNLIAAIDKAREADLNRFLIAGCVPLIGRSASRDIAKAFGSFEDFYSDAKNGCVLFRQINDVGDKMVRNVIANLAIWHQLSFYIKPRKEIVNLAVVKPDKQLTFVITGTLENSRSYYEKIIIDAGHTTSGSVSKNTSYLLAGEKAGSKLSKAEGLGIKILQSEAELLNIING